MGSPLAHSTSGGLCSSQASPIVQACSWASQVRLMEALGHVHVHPPCLKHLGLVNTEREAQMKRHLLDLLLVHIFACVQQAGLGFVLKQCAAS